ncbi:MAG TPA: hypothetical protein VKM55_13575 [Candidatus Lokiarchaeia archaeon]|nr:hypothetical protein [Candidatus Lokiarchaeia archaeon]
MFSLLDIILFNLIFIGFVYGAIIFQKIGAVRAPKFGEEKNLTVLKKLIKNKIWLLGIAINLAAIPYSAFLFSITGIIFIQIAQRAGIILIFIVAVKYLKEKFTRTEIIGLILVYSGFLLMLTVPIESTSIYMNEAESLIYFASAAGFSVVVLFTYNKIKHAKFKEIFLALGAGFSGVTGTLALKVIPIVLARDLNQPGYIFDLFNLPDLFKIIGGIFMPGSGYADGSIYFYFWIGNFAFNFFILQMMYQHGRAGVTVPISYNVNFLVSIVFGFLMFKETMNVFSWIGTCVMVVGIFLTSKIESNYVGKQPASMEPSSIDSEQAAPA